MDGRRSPLNLACQSYLHIAEPLLAPADACLVQGGRVGGRGRIQVAPEDEQRDARVLAPGGE